MQLVARFVGWVRVRVRLGFGVRWRLGFGVRRLGLGVRVGKGYRSGVRFRVMLESAQVDGGASH
jgi:hypothetical protein